jgi:magnesium transporter
VDYQSSIQMINTLYLPELREALAENNEVELREFCTALHPARTAEFMEGLTANESWNVLTHTQPQRQAEIFSYFIPEKQHEILQTQDRDQIASLLAELPTDDRVDMLNAIGEEIVSDLLSRMPAEERKDTLRLSQYPEGTAGAVMTTEFAKLDEDWTITQALDELGHQTDTYETIYYLYVVDHENHLRGLVSARQLVSRMKSPNTKLSELMETDLVVADVMEDQENVANKVAHLDLLAIPVVDHERRMVGIITHDDIIDVVREEATEDAHRSGAVDPLEHTYLKTHLLTLSWKRGMWLLILFFCALLTAFALERYDEQLDAWVWLVPFIPLVISSGGNCGSQSATLVITALSRGHISLSDWARVIWREFLMGLVLGMGLSLMGLGVAMIFPSSATGVQLLVVPVTLLLVVVCGTLTGSILPMIFLKLGWDPALMSNPFVAGIIDILGIVIYMNVAIGLMSLT